MFVFLRMQALKILAIFNACILRETLIPLHTLSGRGGMADALS